MEERVAREEGDDLKSPGEAEMGARAARQAGELAPEQHDRAPIGRKFAGDEVEERRLAGAVGADDEPPFAGRDVERHLGGDAQAAERLLETAHRQRVHGSPRAGAGAGRRRRPRIAQRTSRTEPGTKPSGMNRTMATKIAPNSKFQRAI